MNKKDKLTLYMGIFYMLIILAFGLIIINEKSKEMKKPKIKNNIETYINKKFKDAKDFKYSSIKRKDNTYIMKVQNKKNNDLYFNVIYEKKKITDTYNNDYLKGKTLNKSIENYLNNLIKENRTNNKYYGYSAKYNTSFDKTTGFVKEKLLNKKYNIPIWTLEIEYEYSNIDDLKNILVEIDNYTKSIKLNPKNYHIILNNEKNISKSLEIIIESDIIENDIDEVIKLIKDNNFKYLEKYNVICKYLN